MATSPSRRVFGVLSSLLLATVVVTGLASPANAEDGYRYWNYYHLTDGAWEFSQVGAAEYQPEDGAVEAYRYGTATTSQGITPRADLDEVTFETVCAGEDEAEGMKRVAVLLDYGTEADAAGETPPAPTAECAVVKADATGQQVLETVAELRIEGGLTCAINGYPAQGCGEPVKDAQVATDEQPVAFELPAAATDSTDEAASEQASADNGLLWPIIGVAIVVAAIAAAAIFLSRRNRANA